MWTPPKDLDRRDLHLANWDGDGDCDIIWANPENGNVRVWINDYPTKGTWTGVFCEIPTAVLPLACSEKRGIGIHDCELATLLPTPSPGLPLASVHGMRR